MTKEEISSIRVTKEFKEKLDKLKIHRREPYQEVIERLMKNAK